MILVASPGSAKNTSVMSMLMNSWNSAGRLSKLATASDSSGLGERCKQKSYILKAKKLADSAFQFQIIGGKSA